MMRKIVFILSFTFLLLIGSCARHNGYRYCEGMAWNTLYHITYESDRDLSGSIAGVFELIDGTLSPFNPRSTVSLINSNAFDRTDSLFDEVYKESLKINLATGGAFDPTLAPLIRAWGFGQGHEVSSDTLRIDSLMAFVGIGRTRLENSRLYKEDPRIEFNFSALAKGFGVDMIAEMFERAGIANYLIEVGGEIRCSGKNPGGEEWRIGIDTPREDAAPGETVINISIRNGALATSGNYRNVQKVGGKSFGHTISATTGRPVSTDVISATVIAPTCMEADALATACMALGSEEALALCTRLRAAVLLIKTDMSVTTNPAFAAFLPEQ